MSELNIPFIRERWVPALLSGEYRQAKEVLHDEVGFCCLGVACDILKVELGLEWEWDSEGGFHRFMGEQGVMPPVIQDLIGLDQDGAFTTGQPDSLDDYDDSEPDRYWFDESECDLTGINDKGTPFPVIATYLLKLCDHVESKQTEEAVS